LRALAQSLTGGGGKSRFPGYNKARLLVTAVSLPQNPGLPRPASCPGEAVSLLSLQKLGADAFWFYSCSTLLRAACTFCSLPGWLTLLLLQPHQHGPYLRYWFPPFQLLPNERVFLCYLVYAECLFNRLASFN